MADTRQQGWLDQNATRNYPLADEATGYDVTGTYRLPTDFLVDALLPIDIEGGYDPTLFHISEVSVFSNKVMVGIGYAGETIATFTISSSSHVRNATYTRAGTGAFSTSTFRLTVGGLTDILASSGAYSFDPVGAMFSPMTVRPNLRGVSSLALVRGGEIGELLRGNIQLVEGSNITFTVTPPLTAGEPTRIRIDASVTDTTGADDPCEDETVTPPIRTVNGVRPDESGNLTLTPVSTCLEISPEANGLRFQDTCATSCCSDAELKVVNDELKYLKRSAQTYANTLSQMELTLQEMVASVGSVLAQPVTPDFENI